MSMRSNDVRSLTLLFLGLACGGFAALGLHHLIV
jgi:hypothetical protein